MLTDSLRGSGVITYLLPTVPSKEPLAFLGQIEVPPVYSTIDPWNIEWLSNSETFYYSPNLFLCYQNLKSTQPKQTYLELEAGRGRKPMDIPVALLIHQNSRTQRFFEFSLSHSSVGVQP